MINLMMETLLSVIAAGVGYRWRGSGWPKSVPFTNIEFPHTIRRLFFSLVCAGILTPLLGWYALLVPPIMWFGLITGHGQYFPNSTHGVRDMENMRWITRWFSRTVNMQVKRVGMASTGFVMTLPVGILVGYHTDPSVGGAIALSGILKMPIYWTFYHLRGRFQAWTAYSEYTFGALVGLTFNSVNWYI